jgi:hypothetical protein
MATAHHFSLKKSLPNCSLTLHHGEVPAATIGQLLQIREIKDACPDLFESWAQRSQRLTFLCYWQVRRPGKMYINFGKMNQI